MARTRIRSIKPEFFKHEGLYDLERETGLPIRIAFAGLWTCCDREGRFEWRPRWLKTEILPYDEVDFSRVLDALATRGFLVKYAIGSEIYGCIPSWKKHQVINNKELPSVLPSPTESILIQEPDASLTRVARVADASQTRESPVTDACTTALFIPEAEGERERNGNGKGEAASPAPAPTNALGGSPSENPRDDLHPLQYSSRLLQEIGLPETRSNNTIVAAAITALTREGKTVAAAYEFLSAKAKAAQAEGMELNRFWFEDGGWKGTGGTNGKSRPSDAHFLSAESADLEPCTFGECDGSGWYVERKTRARRECRCAQQRKTPVANPKSGPAVVAAS
jgi:hypothetical protein